jgi:beta-lactamase regulating signal transducer with metallopeptidase domain
MLLIDSIFAAGHNLAPYFSPEIAQTAGATLVTAVWQGAILAVCVAAALKIARRTTAALRFSIWVAGFATAVCIPFWPILLHRLTAQVSLPAASVTKAASSPWLQVDLRWSIALALLWAAASLYRAADLAVHAVRLRTLWKDAKPVPAEKLNLLPAVADSLRSGRRIEICTTLKQDRPGVIGFFAPRILIPEWLLDRLTPGELKQIVMHETEHIRRGDDWTNLLQKLGLVLFPLNPALLWMDRRLCVEREMACDEAVVRATRAPRAYAACLTNLAEHGRAWRHQAMERAALTLGAWRRRSELVGRVQSILRSRNANETSVGTLHSRGIFAVLACGLMVGSAELARCPQLIAFVPAHTEQIAAAQVRPERAMESIAQPITNAMQTISTRYAGQVHMANLKAIVPARGASSYTTYDDIPASSAAKGWKPTPVTIRKAVPARSGRSFEGTAVPPPNTMETATLDGQSPANSAVNSPEQGGWLVLTTWEEVATTESASSTSNASNAMLNTSARNSADTEIAATDQTAARPAQQPDQQVTQQIRVTRVIYRVVPASFVSPASDAARTRAAIRTRISDGWLVLQL